jgi:hypothetical protein
MTSKGRVSNVAILAKMSNLSPEENGSQGSRKRLVDLDNDVDRMRCFVKMRQQGRNNMRRRSLGEALNKTFDRMGQVGFASKKDDLITLIPQLDDLITKKRGNIVAMWNFALGVSNATRLPAMFWDPEIWSEFVLLRWEKFGLQRFNVVIDAMSPQGNIDWDAVPTWRFIVQVNECGVARKVGLHHIVLEIEIRFNDKEADIITDGEFQFVCNKDINVSLESPHTTICFTLKSWPVQFTVGQQSYSSSGFTEDWQREIQWDMNHVINQTFTKRQQTKKGHHKKRTPNPSIQIMPPTIHLVQHDCQSKRKQSKRTSKPWDAQKIAELLKECQ